jgi:hypothetical protein
MDYHQIRNFAGVGYIQGIIIKHLEKESTQHSHKVDGMFGPKTFNGLNSLADTVLGVRSDISSEPSYCFTNGIRLFQSWYLDVYKKCNGKYGQLGQHHLPAPEIDGMWGKNTKACIDFFIQ